MKYMYMPTMTAYAHFLFEDTEYTSSNKIQKLKNVGAPTVRHLGDSRVVAFFNGESESTLSSYLWILRRGVYMLFPGTPNPTFLDFAEICIRRPPAGPHRHIMGDAFFHPREPMPLYTSTENASYERPSRRDKRSPKFSLSLYVPGLASKVLRTTR